MAMDFYSGTFMYTHSNQCSVFLGIMLPNALTKSRGWRAFFGIQL